MTEEVKTIHPAAPKVGVEFEYYNTLYPVINYSDKGVNPFLTSFRRAISGINPFAHQQVSTEDQIALGPRFGNKWVSSDFYPNGIVFERGYPSHYDPLKHPMRPQTSFQKQKYATAQSVPMLVGIEMPRVCKRQIDFYRRCVNANGENHCNQEKSNILNICPTFALDGLREMNLKRRRDLAMDNLYYKEAMQVSEYNKGRTIANVSNKTYVDGKPDKLRPDTLWADDRYVDISQKEINEAKKRMEERAAKKAEAGITSHKAHVEAHHYDWEHVKLLTPKPLYP